ncbi:hypothetical protein N9N28_01630 [Rubripirellula amarantea]|nr:hypothetical protein [Rubripirellula amarantea]
MNRQINGLHELISSLRTSSLQIRWILYPHEPALIWLPASAIHLSNGGIDIPETAFWHRFKQLLSNSIGLFSHTPGATLVANGTLQYSNEHSAERVDISVGYSETPDVIGSCYSGTLSSSIALYELLEFMADGG